MIYNTQGHTGAHRGTQGHTGAHRGTQVFSDLRQCRNFSDQPVRVTCAADTSDDQYLRMDGSSRE